MRVCASSKITVLLIGFSAAILVGAGSAKADFIFGTPINPGSPINSSSSDQPGGMTADGLRLYFASRRPGGYSGWIDIWVTTRPTKDDPWGEPVNLGPAINTERSEFEPDLSPDGLILVFTRVETAYPNWGIWMSTRQTIDDPWEERQNLGPTINSYAEDMDPCISADGLTLYFNSTRSGGYGNMDIYVTTRPTRDDPWGEPVNLGPPVNGPYGDACPEISADGRTMVFNSRRPGGFGDSDLWLTRRPTIDDPWGEPVNLGPTINTSGLEQYPDISPDGQFLMFQAIRPGGMGDRDIWQAPIIPIVDFNGDGIVDSADMCIMIDHWGTNEPLCDIGPTPLGDGIVDVQDLIVLAEHLFEDSRLVAHWALDEAKGDIAYDSTSEHDATLHGEPVWQPDGGMVAGALQLDGVDDYINTAFVLNPADVPFSVTAWIKGGAPGQVVISQADTVVDTPVGPSINPGSAWLSTTSAEGGLMTGLGDAYFGPLVSESVITDDRWHHIALVYARTTMKRHLYVDGAEVAVDSSYVVGESCDAGLYIGAGRDLNASTFFSGLIDEVRIYNSVLSAEEIENLSL